MALLVEVVTKLLTVAPTELSTGNNARLNSSSSRAADGHIKEVLMLMCVLEVDPVSGVAPLLVGITDPAFGRGAVICMRLSGHASA